MYIIIRNYISKDTCDFSLHKIQVYIKCTRKVKDDNFMKYCTPMTDDAKDAYVLHNQENYVIIKCIFHSIFIRTNLLVI